METMQRDAGFAGGTLIVAVGSNHAKNIELIGFAERICRAGNLSMRLFHVYEPIASCDTLSSYPIGLAARSEEILRQAEGSEMQAARERLRFLAASVRQGVQVTTEVTIGDVVPRVHECAHRHRRSIILVGAPDSSAAFPKLFSPSLSMIEDSDVPIIALPLGGEGVEIHLDNIQLLVADDMREESTGLLEAAIDFVRLFGKGRIVDTHVKNLTADIFNASLAEIFVTALGGPGRGGRTPTSLVARIRPMLKRLLNERAQRVFDRKGRDGVSFQSMVLKGDVVKALRRAIQRINADMIVFGRHRMLHDSGDRMGHVPSKYMLSFDKPVLIVPV